MERAFLTVGAVFGGLGVAAGAFAAHGLKSRLAPDLLAVFETGARYQLVHAVALLVVGVLATRVPHPAVAAAGWLFIVGVVVFSGSLYLLAVTGVRWLGAITPIGGVALIAGWLALAWGVLRSRGP
jgi:uncharacterized membrane protein YgdD (TMEM256/DUF423 family)